MSVEDEVTTRYELLKAHLPRRIHRLWAAALGRGGRQIVEAATGITLARIAAGRRELRGKSLRPRAPAARKPGGQFWEDKGPTLVKDLEQLLADEIAGNPMDEERWVRSSTRKRRDRLRATGHPVGHCTVHRLLRKLKYSLRANQKRRGASKSPGRDAQFQYIASQRESFAERNLPVISVDTKHRALIGELRNAGNAWRKEAIEVNEHDFTGTAEYRAVPFGIYDVLRNQGHVTAGISNDTPELAVGAIARWWEQEGKTHYAGAADLLILADCGGDQWVPLQSLEAEPAGEAVRHVWFDGHGLPLPARVLKVESDRASPVQPNQPELGGPATEVAAPHARLYPRDHDYYRADSDSPPR